MGNHIQPGDMLFLKEIVRSKYSSSELGIVLSVDKDKLVVLLGFDTMMISLWYAEDCYDIVS